MPLLPAIKLITPTLVTYTGSGTGSVDGNGTITYSDAPSIRIHGVFTSTYTNYYIALETNFTSTGYFEVFAQMMKSGTINSNTTYTSQYIDASSTTVSGLRVGPSPRLAIGAASSTQPSFTDLYVFSPFQSTTSTCFQSECINGHDSIYMRNYVGTLSDVDSYDGIVFSVTTGTITGTIQVYGFNE